MLIALRFVLLFLAMLMLAGCPGANYAPYDNMRNSYGMNTKGLAPISTPGALPADRAASG